MEQKVGVSLCTSGRATRIAGSHLCHIERDVAMIVSPALPTVEVEHSDDFEECIIAVDMAVISVETAPFLPKMMSVLSTSAPILKLDEGLVARVMGTAAQIASRATLNPEEEIFRQMNDRLADLLRLQVILEIMYEMVTSRVPVKEKSSRVERVFIGFMQSLGQHYAERYPVARYASEANLSVRHFSKVIHNYTGQTPMQWITSYTVSQAKRLLSQTGLSVKEIADRLGFPEQFTFRKYFKTHAGMSPTEFRLANGHRSLKSEEA